MVSRVFHLVYKEIKSVHQAAYVLGFFAFGSQLLAIVRDRLLAHTFGAGVELDLYYTAFRIPDVLFVLFASVLSIYVLLPFIQRTALQKAQKQLLSQVFTLFLIGYTALASLLALMAPWYVPVLFPGYATDTITLTTLMQILLLQPLFLGLSSLCGVITQLNHRFVLYAISPLLYNVGIICGVVFFYPWMGLYGLAVGVVIGAIGHLVVQLPFVIKNPLAFTVRWQFDWGGIRELLWTAIPRSLTLSLNQLVLLLFIGIATTLPSGSVSVFQFAYNIQAVPLAIIGMSYSVAAFPSLTHLFAKQEQAAFNLQVLTAMRHIIFWSVPIIGLFIVLRAQIVRVLLGSGAFDWSDTRLTAAALAVFAVSLVAQALLLLLVRALYAGGKTWLPLAMTMISSVFAIALAYGGLALFAASEAMQVYITSLFRLESLVGVEIVVLAAAFTLGQLLQVLLLLLTARSVFGVALGALRGLCMRAVLASVVGASVSYMILQFVVEGVNQDTLIGILLQGGVAGVGGVLAAWATYAACKTPELTEIAGSFKIKLLKTNVVAKQ